MDHLGLNYQQMLDRLETLGLEDQKLRSIIATIIGDNNVYLTQHINVLLEKNIEESAKKVYRDMTRGF